MKKVFLEVIVFADVQVHVERLTITIPSGGKNVFMERAVHTDS